MNMWSALSSPVSLDAVGLRGTFERHSKREETRPRRAFVIDDLLVEDLEIRVIDHTVKRGRLDVSVVVHRGRSQPMRSEYAVFDALFRSDIDATIAGRSVIVESETAAGGRVTRWRGTELPLGLLSHWVGGPFRWIVSGKLDVEVDDTWQRAETIMIDCHWRLSLHDIVAEVPEDAVFGRLRGGAARAYAESQIRAAARYG